MRPKECGTPLPSPKVIGYLRVSTIDQDTGKHKADILAFANERKLGNVDWVEEKVSGAKSWKSREIAKAVEDLTAGDSLIVPEISRLGRSTIQILEILAELKRKVVSVYAVMGSGTLNGSIES
jgi:DNA invertase Pin-like site-specific DNA recombinase